MLYLWLLLSESHIANQSIAAYFPFRLRCYRTSARPLAASSSSIVIASA